MGISNVVWLATDVHFARLLQYEPGDTLSGLVLHEFIAGPASAILLTPRALLRTFAPLELFVQGRRPDPARPSFFNFGLLRIAAEDCSALRSAMPKDVCRKTSRGGRGAEPNPGPLVFWSSDNLCSDGPGAEFS